jgi:hypothetical protein
MVRLPGATLAGSPVHRMKATSVADGPTYEAAGGTTGTHKLPATVD